MTTISPRLNDIGIRGDERDVSILDRVAGQELQQASEWVALGGRADGQAGVLLGCPPSDPLTREQTAFWVVAMNELMMLLQGAQREMFDRLDSRPRAWPPLVGPPATTY